MLKLFQLVPVQDNHNVLTDASLIQPQMILSSAARVAVTSGGSAG
jgi:hypothetical protein